MINPVHNDVNHFCYVSRRDDHEVPNWTACADFPTGVELADALLITD